MIFLAYLEGMQPLCVGTEQRRKRNFFHIRNMFNRANHMQVDPLAHACYFLYLNKTCFRGIWRENRQGELNVGYGHYAQPPQLVDRTNLLRVSKYLRNNHIQLICCSFEQTLKRAQRGDFVYIDPPYDDTFAEYTAEVFEPANQKLLAKHVYALHRRGVRFLLSNAPTSRILDLYQRSGFHTKAFHAGQAMTAGIGNPIPAQVTCQG